MQAVESYIQKHINNSTIDQLMVERVKHIIINILDSAIEDLEQRKERIDYLRSNDGNDKKIQVMEDRLNFFIETSKKNKEKVVNYAISECGSIRREFKEYLQKSLEEIKDKYTQKLMIFEKYEELETYVKSDELDSEVKVDADKVYDYVEDNMLYCLNDILNNILIRIQEYLKDGQMNSDKQNIDFKIKKGIKRVDADVLDAESALSETMRRESEAREKVNKAQIIRKKEEENIIKGKENLNRDQYNLNCAEDEKKRKILNLGVMPAVEKKTTYKTQVDYEYRGGLGFLDAILGPKRVERRVEQTTIDDSKRKAWVRERDRISDSYNGIIEEFQSILDADKNRISSAEKILKKAKLDEEQARDDLEFYKQKYYSDKKTLENLKKKANQELLNSLRNSLITQLQAYCNYDNGAMAVIIRNYIDETIDINSKIITEKTTEFYETRLNALINSYKNEIEGKVQANNEKYTNYEDELSKIKNIRKELEYAG